ncbi:MAG: LL-diaminopimelate aminotransferase [Phycisphaerae bacterium]|nr:LL-diaminopimelate aminotransferase [Phycisphaerae bacterium]
MAFTQTERLNALPPYLFAEIDRKKRAALSAGRDVIDFGVGDPDQPTYPFIIQAMERALRKPERHRYPLGGGLPEFRRQITTFFQQRYGVELDPQRELLALIGSKEGIGHLPLAVVNPGRTVLIPAPGYPAYHAAAVFAGGEPYALELSAAGGWLPDFDAIPAEIAHQAVLMYLNYPNNPTGATATLDVFRRAVAFAREHDLLLAHDAAYNEMYFTSERPPSILQVPEAREVAIEFHSASKTFNMTGWRIGFAAGNAAVIAALARVKSNLDSGVFGAVQEAAWEAYAGLDRPEIAETRKMYRQRAELLCEGLRTLGFQATPPEATFYVWAGVPEGLDSITVCNRLLEEVNVVGVPGGGFGRAGEGYVRFSVSVPTERIRAAVERMRALEW